ncbi:MAG: PAS domain-containing sensor histidine kinase [Gammaproteobacteria bacterium]
MLQQQLVSDIEREQSAELEQAFNNFNQASSHLTEVYLNLERQVSVLSSELVSVRDERTHQYEEKERIAGRLQDLLKVLPAGIVVLDKDGIIQEHNPAAADLLGKPLLRETWCSIVARVFSPRWDDGHDITLIDGRCVNISTQSLEGEAGQIVLIKEVTETRQLQQQLDRLKRLSAMGDMASSLAHQIRTPLSSALLYAAHLRNTNLGEALQTRFVNKLMGRLQHLESLVEDMLLFARGGRFDSKPRAVQQLVKEFAESVEPQLEQTGAKLIVTDHAADAVIDINSNAIISTFQNLLTNAIQAGKHPITMNLRILRSDAETLEITFSDDGPGIDEAIQNRIFEPFYTTHSEGTGLGLTVAEAVIRAHGGQIRLESQTGKGATFRINLPIIDDARKS